MGKERDYKWLDSQRKKDNRETSRAKLKFIKEIRQGLGEEIKDSSEELLKKPTFVENMVLRLKKVFG
tara:strand:+ start:883 stop:1083 length:201 start_codon:yes stop_codon:yes gene_type:complete